MQNLSKKLTNGREIPLVGLGTWKATGKEVERTVRVALELGYRHIDTAKIYLNEKRVGAAIRASGIAEIAEAHGKSNAQIFLRWSIQHGNIILPKSTNPERIGENIKVFDFELSTGEMERIDGLNEGLRTCWDPSEVV